VPCRRLKGKVKFPGGEDICTGAFLCERPHQGKVTVRFGCIEDLHLRVPVPRGFFVVLQLLNNTVLRYVT